MGDGAGMSLAPLPMPAAPTLEARLAVRERPVPPHVLYQRWEHLLFLHWRWDADAIQRTLPPGLFVDTFRGDAWLAIVPFFMRGIRPRFCPPVSGLSDFLELNVRTYVYDDRGRPGVWFYSLDCNQPIAVWTARTIFHLPYRHARMQAHQSESGIDYTCRRDGESHTSNYRYHLADAGRSADPGTLEFFLAERYLLFSPSPRGLRCGRVNHPPYPLAEAQVDTWDAAPLLQAGFPDPARPPDHVIGSSGVQVRVYALTS